jgi:hypothetical protein
MHRNYTCFIIMDRLYTVDMNEYFCLIIIKVEHLS